MRVLLALALVLSTACERLDLDNRNANSSENSDDAKVQDNLIKSNGNQSAPLTDIKLKIFDVPMSMEFIIGKDFTFSLAPLSPDVKVDGYYMSLNQSICSSGGCELEELFGKTFGGEGKFRLESTDELQKTLTESTYTLQVFVERKNDQGVLERSEKPNLSVDVNFKQDYAGFLNALTLTLQNAPAANAFSFENDFSFSVVPSSTGIAIDSYKVEFTVELCTSAGCVDSPLFEKSFPATGQLKIVKTDPLLALFENGGLKAHVRAIVIANDILQADKPNLSFSFSYARGCKNEGVKDGSYCFYQGVATAPASSAGDGKGESCIQTCSRLNMEYDAQATIAVSKKSDHSLCLAISKKLDQAIASVITTDSANTSGKYGCFMLTAEANTLGSGPAASVQHIIGSAAEADVDGSTQPRFVGQSRVCGCK